MDPHTASRQLNCFADDLSFDIDLSYIRSIPQRDTNRCWLICAVAEPLSRFRMTYRLEDFDLSMNYLAFWDCMEKCRMFFRSIAATRDLPVRSEAVQRIFRFGIDDGGDWINAAEVITKYGVVPENAMPETKESADPQAVFWDIVRYVRHIAARLRGAADARELAEIRDNALDTIYAHLVEKFGPPPDAVELSPGLKEKLGISETKISPRTLAQMIFGDSLLDQYSFVSVDSGQIPLNTRLIFPYNGYQILAPHTEYINIGFDELKDKILRQLQDGKAVPIACDARYCRDPEERILDLTQDTCALAFDIDRKTGFDFQLLRINHCMLVVGVKKQPDGSRLWKFINSWADEPDTFYYATDRWFDAFVSEAVIAQKYCAPTDYPECEMLPESVIL